MLHNAQLAQVVLAVTAGVLVYAAATDLKHFKIPNEVILILAGLFILHTLILHRWKDIIWSFGLTMLVLGFLIYFYSRRWIGGGDLKLLTVALLWAGAECALPFAVLLCLFATLHAAAASLGLVRSGRLGDPDTRPPRIAFAPSIAAAMLVVFALDCVG